ncbi:hypothetical protein [Methylosinus sp. LW4]|uniref:hypothetical protein n=1 Tax=Methylosinus sp. LW4 TaxID=136993 RepID=UPI00036CCEC2|nr:hypothetical protein [Methylosinus sp. LW4]
MKLDLSNFHFPAGLRAKALTLVIGVALGAMALSLGGCSCTDPYGNEMDCPGAY